MDLDPKAFEPLLKSLAAAGLPYLGTAVGALLTPVMGPFGMLVSPAINLAVSGITKALGLPDNSTPEQIASAVDADPQGAKDKLAGLEEQHRFDLAKQKQSDDTAIASQAQQVSLNLAQAQSGGRIERWVRPAIMWGIGALLMLSAGLPFLVWGLVNFGLRLTDPPKLDLQTIGILASLLGITVALPAVTPAKRTVR